MNKNGLLTLLALTAGWLLTSCSDYLELKPDQSLVVPHTLQDLEALLNNAEIMNEETPNLGEVSAGDSYIFPASWQNFDIESRQVYLWERELTLQSPLYLQSWSESYRMILYANIVLEGLADIIPNASEQARWNRAKGSALFYRSWAFMQLMGIFCEAYDPAKSQDQPGVPLRLSSAVEQDLRRASLKDCYAQVTTDLQTAIQHLPAQSSVKTQPNQAAVHALLARVYLFMNDYPAALKHANSSLELQNELIDYNDVDSSTSYSFVQLNKEVIFHTIINRHSALPQNFGSAYVDSTLYNSYENTDLRKQLFFNMDDGVISYKGSYDGSRDLFTGLATDEMYMTKAECLAHSGQAEEAAGVLNKLLQKRFDQSGFIPFQADSPAEALDTILAHRRKELVFRGVRWPDIKRLYHAGLFKDTLKRFAEGEIFLLPPGDKRYVLPIPQMVIERSGIQQNDR